MAESQRIGEKACAPPKMSALFSVSAYKYSQEYPSQQQVAICTLDCTVYPRLSKRSTLLRKQLACRAVELMDGTCVHTSAVLLVIALTVKKKLLYEFLILITIECTTVSTHSYRELLFLTATLSRVL